MKQTTAAVGLLALGLMLGQAMPQVFAQAPQPEVQKWEQFCELTPPRKGVDLPNQNAAAHGKKGYQLVGASLSPNASYLLCYRRPAR